MKIKNLISELEVLKKEHGENMEILFHVPSIDKEVSQRIKYMIPGISEFKMPDTTSSFYLGPVKTKYEKYTKKNIKYINLSINYFADRNSLLFSNDATFNTTIVAADIWDRIQYQAILPRRESQHIIFDPPPPRS